MHQHDGWQVMFWDMSAALQLLREEYPWFLETFQGYKRRVQQGMPSTSGINADELALSNLGINFCSLPEADANEMAHVRGKASLHRDHASSRRNP